MKKIIPKKLHSSFLRHKRGDKKPGDAPGTLHFTGEQRVDQVHINLYDYDSEQLSEHDFTKIGDSKTYLDSPSKTWINISGLHDVEKLKEIWNYFKLHPLVQEDIISTNQRAKIEQYDSHLFIVLKMIAYENNSDELQVEQVSIVMGDNWLLSFQESGQAIYEPVLHRLRNRAPRLRNNGVDYLSYALIDTIVDHYFKVLENVGDEIEELEDAIIQNFDEFVPEKIHALRRKLNYFRKAIWPLRDSLNGLIRDDSPS